MLRTRILGLAWLFLVLSSAAAVRAEGTIELSADTLVQQAMTEGKAADGALVFYSPQLGCARCHSAGDGVPSRIGPDLAVYAEDERPSNAELAESIAFPSKRIRKGYENYLVVTTDGRTLSGRIWERKEGRLVIQDSTGQVSTVAEEEIEGLRASELSTMPTGLPELIGSRTQLVNLIRYLIEIRDGGPARAAELRPHSALISNQVAPYESSIDHATLLEDATEEVMKQGESIYGRVCANCHGTLTEPGSLPNSLRFAEGKFKNGSDPYSMYRTLTHGFGLMTPQHWMVPKQKYAVIHYIRQHFLQERNPSQWTAINSQYLASLPKGDSLGPEPSRIDPWNSMDYGPSLTHTYQVSSQPLNIAYKGIAIRLDPGLGGVARGDHWTIFDTDTLRWAAGWRGLDGTKRFIDWKGIQFNGQHQVHPSIVGEVVFANANGPGWAHPVRQSFEDDERVEGRDQRRYGPLPRDWGSYLGQYRWGNSVLVAYRIGDAIVHERPGYGPPVSGEHGAIFERTLWLGARRHDLRLKVSDLPATGPRLRCGYHSTRGMVEWEEADEQLILRIKAGEAFSFSVGLATDERTGTDENRRVSFDLPLSKPSLAEGSSPWLQGGPASWTTTLQTSVATVGSESDPFQVDFLQIPSGNPWAAQMRCTGLDFFSDGSLAVCTWDGDVWKVSEQAAEPASSGQLPSLLTWKRIASGLFQPLGLKIVNDQIYVTCRDQLARLHDLNADGEIDFYECFNNDHQVTEHFHEFAMGLQRDDQGNFYYAKSARHALKAIVPHHGTLLKVSPDGTRTEIIANGFRAANGVCLNPDGSFFVTDQEGHWNPKNRINLVKPALGGSPRFYGNLFGYSSITDKSDEAMEKPLCWITNEFDRSPGELVWVNSDAWSQLKGGLLNLSYGTGKVFLVLPEQVGPVNQGGMIALPIPDFPTGVMRGRFHPDNGQLYLCGMFAWAGNAQHPGGLYRLRMTNAPLRLPKELRTRKSGLELRFVTELRRESVRKENVAVKIWSLKRTANYGSKHLDERPLPVENAVVESDGRTVRLDVPSVQPTWCMEIQYRFEDLEGHPVVGKIHNTIHALGEP